MPSNRTAPVLVAALLTVGLVACQEDAVEEPVDDEMEQPMEEDMGEPMDEDMDGDDM
jgi:hypothetical protein